MQLSGKQLIIGSAALVLVSFGAAFAIYQLTGDDDRVVARLTEADRVNACDLWNQGALAAAHARAVELLMHNAHVAVFLDQDISENERKKLEVFIEARLEVDSVIYESQAEAYRRFIELFANEPEILDATPAEALPESFRVVLRKKEDFDTFRDAVADLPGVNEVRDDRHVRVGKVDFDGPLYLIRKQGFYLNPVGRRVLEPPGCTS